DIIPDGDGACFAMFVANNGAGSVHIDVDYDGTTLPIASFARIPSGQGKSIVYGPYDDAAGLGEGEVAILFLSQDIAALSQMPNCPIGAAISTEASVRG